jgi:hypothetical protein
MLHSDTEASKVPLGALLVVEHEKIGTRQVLCRAAETGARDHLVMQLVPAITRNKKVDNVVAVVLEMGSSGLSIAVRIRRASHFWPQCPLAAIECVVQIASDKDAELGQRRCSRVVAHHLFVVLVWLEERMISRLHRRRCF